MTLKVDNRPPVWRALCWFLLLPFFCSAGCGSYKPPPAPPVGTVEGNLEAICNAYNKAFREGNRAPKSVDELKPHLRAYGDPDQLLVSPNDGEPFVIVFGADPTVMPTAKNPQLVAYEKRGKDGKRFAIEPRGGIRQYTDEELSKLRFPPGHKLQL